MDISTTEKMEQSAPNSQPVPGVTPAAGGEKSLRTKRTYTSRAMSWDTPIPPVDEGETVLTAGGYEAEILQVERVNGDGRKAPILRLGLQLSDPKSASQDKTSLAVHLRVGVEAQVRELFCAFLGLNTRDAFIPPWDSLKGAKARVIVSGQRWGEQTHDGGKAQEGGKTFITRFEPLPPLVAAQEVNPVT